MKSLILILFMVILTQTINAGTCTQISRTNYSANQILTSSSLNADFNTVYNNANAYDAGCITSGTLEDDALNTTDFAVPLKAIKEGCNLTKSDSNTISVSACLIGINDGWTNAATATTVTWGCAGNSPCATEAASTNYYVYALDTSTTSELKLGLSTSEPDATGYLSGNRVLGLFRNDGSSNIATGPVSWVVHSMHQYQTTAITVLQDVKDDGTNGGTSSTNTVHTRTLNNLIGDTTYVALNTAFNRFILQPGFYHIQARAPGYRCNNTKIFLWDVAASAYIAEGSNAFNTNAADGDTMVYSQLEYFLTITTAKYYEIRQFIQTGLANTGLGLVGSDASSPDTREIYTQVIIRRMDI